MKYTDQLQVLNVYLSRLTEFAALIGKLPMLDIDTKRINARTEAKQAFMRFGNTAACAELMLKACAEIYGMGGKEIR